MLKPLQVLAELGSFFPAHAVAGPGGQPWMDAREGMGKGPCLEVARGFVGDMCLEEQRSVCTARGN